jgi:hypothetical protein
VSTDTRPRLLEGCVWGSSLFGVALTIVVIGLVSDVLFGLT